MGWLASTGLDRFNPAQAGASGMRRAATGLLLVAACLYLAARLLEPSRPGFAWLRAFAEAAMVGGLADWFAVTALFRHPLGLPVPHTAIIPRNKDRIGDSLAGFLRANFLTPAVVARRMRRMDLADAFGRFLTQPRGDGRLRQGASRLAVGLLQALDDERLGGMAKGALAGRLRALEVSPLIGQALAAAIDENRHAPILDALMVWAGKTLTANEQLIHQMVRDRAGTMMRWTGLDATLSQKIVEGLEKLLTDVAADPGHPLRAKAEEGLARLADNLRTDPATREKVEQMKAELIANPAVTQWMDGLWRQARAALIRAASDPTRALDGRVREALASLGETLRREPALRMSINRFARRTIAGIVANYGDAIVRLVSDTVRGWDAGTVTGRLEAAVGRDLQYIRINGTLVGGLAGLAIHAVDRALG